MARLVHWTDLHGEFAPFTIPAFPKEGVDAVLVGGDTDVGMRALETIEAIWDAWRVPVLFVLGNHEYYGHEVHALHAKIGARVEAAQRLGKDITWLRGDARVVAGVRVVGATLWTDMGLIQEQADILRIGLGMNDYRRIGIVDAQPLDPDAVVLPKARYLEVADTVAWHHREWAAIEGLLAQPHLGPTVVLTHHLPSPLCIAPRFRGDRLNPAFASDKTAAIQASCVDWWFYGHSHGPIEHDLPRADGGVCRLRSNCRGYPTEWERTQFDPHRVFTVG
jgi:Calcineurin-like phosphoesterase